MKKIVLAVVAFLLVLLCGGCTAEVSEVDPNVIYMRYGIPDSTDEVAVKGALYFAKLVDEASEGRLIICVYSDGELGDDKELLEQLSFGGIDFALVGISGLIREYPEMSILCLPYLFENKKQLWEVLDGEIGQRLTKFMDEEEMCSLCWFDAGALSYCSSRLQLRIPEDFFGRRVAIGDNIVSYDSLSLLNAKSVACPGNNLSSSFEQNVIDCAETTLCSYAANDMNQYARYLLLDNHIYTPCLQLVGNAALKRLSEEQIQIIQESAKAATEYERKLYLEEESAAMETLSSRDCEIFIPSGAQLQEFKDEIISLYPQYTMTNRDIYDRIVFEIRNK